LNPDKVTSKNPARSAGFFVFIAFNIYVDKRIKTKIPKIAQQFWVYACYELPQRNTRQRNPEPITERKARAKSEFK
jgi:hypothetical protein